MPDVLITGARAPAALDIARSFKAAGWTVHFADSRPGVMALWSGLGRVHRYASPALRPDAFRRDLVRLLDGVRPDLIVPVCEEVFHLAQAFETNPTQGRLFAPPTETLDRLHSKFRFVELCQALGLPVPATRRVTRPDQLLALAPEAEGLVFKPEYSRFGVEALIGPSAEALAAITPSAARPWVAQERIRGREVCFYSVAVQGRATAFSAYGAPWRMPDGVGYAFAPLSEAEAGGLLDMAERLATVVETGQFACDVMMDAEGRPWLLECNPRATSGAHLFGGGRALADAMTALAETRAMGGEAGCLGPAMWRYGLPTALRQGRLAEWSDSRRGGGDVIGRGAHGSVFGAMLDSVAFSAMARLSGCRLEQAMTRDIEWNGPEGAR